MKLRKTIPTTLVLVAIAFLLSSCGAIGFMFKPVNHFTQTKKVPRNYSVNYNHDNVRSEKSDLNQKAWVVYSDRAGNATTLTPGGTLPFKELKFMEPLYVIGRRGDYYKLIKYNPAVMSNEKLAKRKEAEFYGWIHKDLLLLFNNSETEVRNGIKLKSLAAITECEVMLEAEKYFNADSLVLYSAPGLKEKQGGVGLGSVMYVMKTIENGTRMLVSQKTLLSPDNVAGTAVGWVDASLIAPFGQRLVLSSPPDLPTTEVAADSTFLKTRQTTSPVSLSPAIFAHRVDTTLVFRTLNASEILDHSPNRIYNVDGEPISWNDSKQIALELKNINVIFAIIPTGNVVAQMPMLANAIQNLKPVFEKTLATFRYSYAAVVGDRTVGFNTDYLAFSDRLIEAGQSADTLRNADFEKTIRSSLALAAANHTATNIIIMIGEKVSARNPFPRNLFDEFVRCNGRLFSYQVYTDNADVYNNFVLQSLETIEAYAERYRTEKRKISVFTEQLRPENLFLEGAKNSWALDFPARSITQGMVVFPEKGKFADSELLISGVDSLVRQVESDNNNIVRSIERAHAQVGHHRSRFQSDVVEHLGIDPQTKLAPHIGRAFDQTIPRWVAVTDRISMPVDSAGMSTIGLLLTEAELENVKVWVEGLAAMKPDKKGEVTSNKQKFRNIKTVRRKLRGIPADIDFSVEAIAEPAADSFVRLEYAPTGKIRRHLQKLYLGALKMCVVEGSPRNITLAEAQELITTMPTINPDLKAVRIKDIPRKSKITNWQLEMLIKHFEEHKGIIEKEASPVKDLTTPAGEKFFFLPSKALP
jgi:hypothetical protein